MRLLITMITCLDAWGSRYFIGGPNIKKKKKTFQRVHIFRLLLKSISGGSTLT